MTDYKHTEEYRNRFALNKGERYWLEQAIEYYVRAAEADVAKNELGVIAPGYLTQLFKDIDSKLEMWTDWRVCSH